MVQAERKWSQMETMKWGQKWRLVEMVNMLGRLNEKNQNIMDLEYA